MRGVEELVTRSMRAGDPAVMAASFAQLGGGKTVGLFERYLAEQSTGGRPVFVAEIDGGLAGYVTVLWRSAYQPFAAAGIPEVSDLNVLPAFRRRGIATALMDEAERLIAQRSDVAGLGVGLYADYGPAQRMYVQRGYVPDGRGIMYDVWPVTPGASIPIDDDAVLMMTRRLR
jgi:GNAT superfamily N-acetyltransferase